ncbi:MAG TPA: CopG family transcriptional regulator [Solimonas sp.]
MGRDGRNAARVTTTLTKDKADALKRLAEANGVKEAWLIRRAVEKLLSEVGGGTQLPLDFQIK